MFGQVVGLLTVCVGLLTAVVVYKKEALVVGQLEDRVAGKGVADGGQAVEDALPAKTSDMDYVVPGEAGAPGQPSRQASSEKDKFVESTGPNSTADDDAGSIDQQETRGIGYVIDRERVERIIQNVPEEFRHYIRSHPAVLTADSTADCFYSSDHKSLIVLAIGRSSTGVRNPKVACEAKSLAAYAAFKDPQNIERIIEVHELGAKLEIVAELRGKARGLPVVGEWRSVEDGVVYVSVLYGKVVRDGS